MGAAERIDWFGEYPALLWSLHPCAEGEDEVAPANDNAHHLALIERHNVPQSHTFFPHARAGRRPSTRQGEAQPAQAHRAEQAGGWGLILGLQYFGKRYLNPLLGRWVSADPLAIHAPGEADLNVYAYVSGSVLKNVDPLGLKEESVSADVSDDVSIDDMETFDADNSYLSDLSGEAGSDEWTKGFVEQGNREEAKDNLAFAEKRAAYINAPMTAQEETHMAYIQKKGGDVELFKEFRVQAREWMFDNMRSYEIALTGASRPWSNEVERNKGPDAVFKHWAGFAQDWQPIMGPAVFRNDKDWSSRVVSPEQLKGQMFNEYNNAMADIAGSVGLKPGFYFKDSREAPDPHPEHFEVRDFNGQNLTSAVHDHVRTGQNGLSAKPVDRSYSQESTNASRGN